MIISCDELRQELSSYMDGELDEHTQLKVRKHLNHCSGCREVQESWRALGQLLSDSHARVAAAAPDLWESLAGKIPAVCQCIQEDLSAYLDGELLPSSRDGVSQHLEECSVCLARFQDLSRMNSLLSRGLELPDSVQVDVWSSIKQRLDDDCVLIGDELSAFVDKEVSILRHRAITSHLIDCACCRDQFIALSTTGDLLRSAYQPDLPEDFDLWPAIQDRLKVLQAHGREKSRSNVVSLRRLYVAAAAVMLGIVASIVLFINVHPGASVPPITAEAYLIESTLGEPSDVAEVVVYDVP